jgi:hypothetical protein
MPPGNVNILLLLYTSWYIIENNINKKLNEERSKHYSKLKMKLAI